MKKLLCFIQLLFIGFVTASEAAMPVNPSYVSPSGSGTSCTQVAPCALSYANSNADDDDVVIMADGTYTTAIHPAKAGSAGHPITYQAANKWGAIIGNPESIITNYEFGIRLVYSYIKVDGVKIDATQFDSVSYPYAIFVRGTGVEIVNCWFYGPASVRMGDGNGAATHLWFHNNLVEGNTAIGGGNGTCDDATFGFQENYSFMGSDGYNTIEDNIFRWGGHHNVETFTKYNVIRNNFMHNEGNMVPPEGGCALPPDSNGKYGNRNIQIYDGKGTDGIFALLEGNRFGPAGVPPDDTGWGGEGLTITAPKNIVRYNSVYDAANNNVMFKTGYLSLADDNRFYNNTIYHGGRYNQGGGFTWQGGNFVLYGKYNRVGNVIKNNILYSYGTGGKDFSIDEADYDFDAGNTLSNNFCTDAAAGRCSANGDPLFVDGSLPAITSTPTTTDPNLALQSGSPAINGGTSLTLANGAVIGDSNATLHVDDALYFQDGTWGSSLSNIQADWIAIGTVTNVVQISSIDYATNTITLASPMTWADDAPIWLYKKSDGERVLYGSAPDYGAHEYNPSDVLRGRVVGNLSGNVK